MPRRPFLLLSLVVLLSPVAAFAGAVAETVVLPPELPWEGASRSLAAAAGGELTVESGREGSEEL